MSHILIKFIMEEVRLARSPTAGYLKFPSIPFHIIPYLSFCYLSHIMLCISNGCKSHSHTTQPQWPVLKILIFRSICWEEKTEEFFQKTPSIASDNWKRSRTDLPNLPFAPFCRRPALLVNALWPWPTVEPSCSQRPFSGPQPNPGPPLLTLS